MIGLVMLLAAQSATFMKGEDLFALCKGDKAGQLECLRYVEGVADGIGVTQWADARNRKDICVPPKVTVKKLAAVTVKYMSKYPSQRDLQGGIVVWKAFKKAYSCAK